MLAIHTKLCNWARSMSIKDANDFLFVKRVKMDVTDEK